MSFIKLEADEVAVHIEAGGTNEELIAGWAAATVRFEDLLKRRGEKIPGDMLRKALADAERMRGN